MMHKLFFLILLFGAIPSTGWTDSNIRPGLWEITTTSDLLALVSHIPSEQMEQITSLARQYGLEIPQIQNGVATSTICITQEMVEEEIPAGFFENRFGCAAKNATKEGNRYKVDLACDSPEFKGNGKAEGTFTSPESFTGLTEFESVIQGNPVYAHAESQGRWINSDCVVMTPLQ